MNNKTDRAMDAVMLVISVAVAGASAIYHNTHLLIFGLGLAFLITLSKKD